MSDRRAALDDWLDRTLFIPVAAVRPYLVLKGTLLLLALDMWLTRASHAGRYGAGGFNVAHWAWLDAIQPPVSPAVHVGVCVFVGLLAIAIVLLDRAPRWLVAIAFVAHTWSWAMSMLDSYQHHYLLSIVLLALMFVEPMNADMALHPKGTKRKRKGKRKGKKRRSAEKKTSAVGLRFTETIRRRAPLTSCWAYALFCWSAGIVYLYTAFSKTDPEWLSGASLKRVLNLPESGVAPLGGVDPIGPARRIVMWFGDGLNGVLDVFGADPVFDSSTFWWFMGHSVVVVQIICASGYALAPFRDVAKSRVLRAYYWIALATVLSFHLGAEYMNLQIGWFSWYMIGYALVVFLPSSWWVALARLVIPLEKKEYRTSEFWIARALLVISALIVAMTSSTWVDTRIFGVPLSRIFGVGINAPMLAMCGVLALIIATRSLRAVREGQYGIAGPAAIFGAFVTLAAAWLIDLPGALIGGVLVVVVLGAGLFVQHRAEPTARAMLIYGFAATVCGSLLYASIAASEVRWDYYRNVGGDHRRRGEIREAYEAYVKANRYAPEGEDRREREEEMRQILETRGEL